MGCGCKSYKYASDYRRITDLAQKQANFEKVKYIVFQKKDTSYGYCKEGFEPEGSKVQFIAIPNN